LKDKALLRIANALMKTLNVIMAFSNQKMDHVLHKVLRRFPNVRKATYSIKFRQDIEEFLVISVKEELAGNYSLKMFLVIQDLYMIMRELY